MYSFERGLNMIEVELGSVGIRNLQDYMIAAVRSGNEHTVQYLCSAVKAYYISGGLMIKEAEAEIVSKLSVWFERTIESDEHGVDECFSGFQLCDGEWGEFFRRGHDLEYSGARSPCYEYGVILYRALMRIGMLDYVLYMHPDAEFVFEGSAYYWNVGAQQWCQV